MMLEVKNLSATIHGQPILVGIARDVLQQLSMEFAGEAQKLIANSLEGSVE